MAIPLVLPMVAMPMELLLQVPPLVVLLYVVVEPTHTFEPVIDAGSALTVSAFENNVNLKLLNLVVF